LFEINLIIEQNNKKSQY